MRISDCSSDVCSSDLDPRPPFLACLMLLEDCPAARAPVRCEEPHYPVFDEFRGASYAQRYQILCERLVERQLYTAAAFELTPNNSTQHPALTPATSTRNLFAEFSGKQLAAQAGSNGSSRINLGPKEQRGEDRGQSRG